MCDTVHLSIEVCARHNRITQKLNGTQRTENGNSLLWLLLVASLSGYIFNRVLNARERDHVHLIERIGSDRLPVYTKSEKNSPLYTALFSPTNHIQWNLLNMVRSCVYESCLYVCNCKDVNRGGAVCLYTSNVRPNIKSKIAGRTKRSAKVNVNVACFFLLLCERLARQTNWKIYQQ